MKSPKALFIVAALAVSIPISGNTQENTTQPEINLSDFVVVEDYLKPFRDIRPAPSEAGRISEIYFKNGDEVKAGDLILKLDTSVQETSLEIAKLEANSTALVDAATAEVDLAQQKLDALKRIKASAQEIRKATSALLVAQARLTAEEENQQKAKHRVTQITAEIERRSIRSPFDGKVVDIDADISEYLSPNDAPVVHIVQNDKLKLAVKVGSQFGNKIRVGTEYWVKLKDQDQEYTKGVVDYVDSIDDSSSGTFRVGLIIDNTGEKIRPGSDAAVLLPRMLLASNP